jgi:hypothetical protein
MRNAGGSLQICTMLQTYGEYFISAFSLPQALGAVFFRQAFS